MKYKWEDKVRIKSKKELECISEVTDGMLKNGGAIMTIACLVEDADGYIMKEDGDFHFLWTDEMIEGLVEEEVFIKANDIYNEEYSKGEYCHEQSFKWGFQEGYNCSHENDKLEISLKEGYQFKDENGNIINATKIVLEKKKKEYPETYEECEKVLRYDSHRLDNMGVTVRGYKWELIRAFQILLICRDAYWKIVGEEMGLGKPWKPDWNTSEPKYVISCTSNGIEKQWETTYCKVLAFPTEEMRDAFYENFKELIEQCKELL